MRKSKKFISIILSLVMLVSAAVGINMMASAASYKTVSGAYNYSYASQVLTLVNEQRRANGLKALTMTQSLTDGAMLRAAETTVSFSHTRPNGEKCFTAFSWTGAAGENIAYGQRSPSEVMNGWMNSSGHRANILSSSYTTIGIGCFVYNGTLYWAQAFSGGSGTAYSPSGSKNVTVDVSLTTGVPSVVHFGSETTTKLTTAAQTTTKVATTKQTTAKPPTTQPSTAKESTSASTTKKPAASTTKKATASRTTTKKATTRRVTTRRATTAKQTTAKCSSGSSNASCAKKDAASVLSSLPQSTCITGICPSANGFTVNWDELSDVAGYQIRYCTNSNMSDCKTINISDCDTAEKTISNLLDDEKYYVQVRSCKTVCGVNLCSPWSAKQVVVTK